jgi:hypothetical protein
MEIFVSYNPETDRGFYERMAAALRRTPFKPLSVNLKERFGDEIHYHVTGLPFTHDAVLVASSPGYITSRWHTKELAAFISHEVFWERQGRIVPVLVDGSDLPDLIDGPAIVDFRHSGFNKGVQTLMRHLRAVLGPSNVFVIMRLGCPDLERVYAKGFKPSIRAAGLKPFRITDTILNDRNKYVPLEIIRQIGNSSIVVADLTEERPNCYYEAGYAHALNKPVILTARTGSTVHFDLAGKEILFWDNAPDLKAKLERELRRVLKRFREHPLAEVTRPAAGQLRVGRMTARPVTAGHPGQLHPPALHDDRNPIPAGPDSVPDRGVVRRGTGGQERAIRHLRGRRRPK